MPPSDPPADAGEDAPDLVTVEPGDDLTWVHVDDGKVNALSRRMVRRLNVRVREAVGHGTPIAIAGRPGGVFSAGLDLRELPQLDRGGAHELFTGLEDVVRRIVEAPVPVVAAVEGPAVAGGAIVALACDRRVAAADAPVGVPELEVGVPFPDPVLHLLRERLGPRAFRTTVMEGRRVTGDDALASGWVDETSETVREDAAAMARRMMPRNPAAFAQLKDAQNRPLVERWARESGRWVEPYLDVLLDDATQGAIRAGVASALGDG